MRKFTDEQQAKQTKPIRFSCDLDRTMHKQLKLKALEQEKKSSEIVREAIAMYLAR